MTEFSEAKFEQLQGKVMADVGGAVGLLMAHIGDQTGVYQALEEIGPCTHEALATKAGVDVRLPARMVILQCCVGLCGI